MTETILVVGGGHAGAEAAAAAARLGARSILLTLAPEAVGRMSCNPAIGGIGKGQLVREIDALGGIMGRCADRTAIQFRLLNTSKGLAAQSPRVQSDRHLYEAAVRSELAELGVETRQGEAIELLSRSGRCHGVRLVDGTTLHADAVVLTTGTFLEGTLHCGTDAQEGGRVGEGASHRLGTALRALGLPTGRLKTGTPPRLRRESVELGALEIQPGDERPQPFSFEPQPRLSEQVVCWLTRTNEETHAIVRDHLHLAPMYAGRIQGEGPRYCPSIEDKVVRFADRTGHVVFLEPEGLSTDLLYANGISTSLPPEVQQAFVRTIPGLERAVLAEPGYAVEYTFVRPRSLDRTMAVRDMPGLYLAGQICGTSGYEEAAAQGLIAGANAVFRIRGEEPFLLGRDQAYLAVLVDDLVLADPSEPYRMFTSRAEHRLLLRHDTADRRLTPLGHARGLVSLERHRASLQKEQRIHKAKEALESRRSAGRPLTHELLQHGADYEVLRAEHPEHLPRLKFDERRTLEGDLRYSGYIERQNDWVERLRERETASIPLSFSYATIPGLSAEARDTLEAARPETLGAAGRLAGVRPGDLALIEIVLSRATLE